MEQKCRCLELEERVLKAEERYIDLESEMKKGRKEFESLELRFKEMESEKLVMEEEFRKLKESGEDSLIEQMMVNKALEVEKQVASKEAEDWKRKFEKLVEKVRELDEMGSFRYGDENLKLGNKIESCKVYEDGLCKEGLAYHQSSGSPYITTPVKENIMGRRRDNVSSRRQLNKMLVFEGDGCKSTDVLVDLSERSEKESDAMDTLEEGSIGEKYDDEDVEACEVNTSTPLPGRKRKLVITSDSENDDDGDGEGEDNIPISVLKKLKPANQEMSDLVDTPTTGENGSGRLRRQRRVSSRLSKQRFPEEMSASSERNSKQRLVGISTTGNAEDDETEEESEQESESESLDGFIVDDEIVSEKSDETGEEESDCETGYAHVISRLRRDKNPEKRKWEYEADMLADFGKDPELCMRAVCVLYRFQTEDEKMTSSSHVSNGRGFSKFDAVRGTRIGKFLTDGDPKGDLKKSVEELKSFEFDAVEICRYLAGRYSKQLFQIYNNREDPFFTLPPSP